MAKKSILSSEWSLLFLGAIILTITGFMLFGVTGVLIALGITFAIGIQGFQEIPAKPPTVGLVKFLGSFRGDK